MILNELPIKKKIKNKKIKKKPMILDERILTSQHQESYQRKLAKNEVTKKHDRKEETFCS